jgi:hypothetical protein
VKGLKFSRIAVRPQSNQDTEAIFQAAAFGNPRFDPEFSLAATLLTNVSDPHHNSFRRGPACSACSHLGLYSLSRRLSAKPRSDNFTFKKERKLSIRLRVTPRAFCGASPVSPEQDHGHLMVKFDHHD